MRFSFLLALKYLLPRRGQLSQSLIALVSLGVISLVVWLALVFLSVTEGIEKKWLEELTTLNAPIKVRPKEAYYQSYYYLIDSLAQKSQFTLKSLKEKLLTSGDPYDSEIDPEPPRGFPSPDLNADGSIKELTVLARDALKGYKVGNFEAGFGNLNLYLPNSESVLTQLSYIVPLDLANPSFAKLILSPRKEDMVALSQVLKLKECSLPVETFLATPYTIPSNTILGEGLLLPKNFQKSNIQIGATGYLSYYTPSTTMGMQEQRLPIYVAGFYDPGMMPLGGKMLFASSHVPALLKNNMVTSDEFFGAGFSVYLDNLADVEKVKKEIALNLERSGISQYFAVESFLDFEFSRPLLEQLKSDKTLFTLIAIIILIVACSNIVSMLLLLVNDKKKEIATLQAMGATKGQIVSIFGCVGLLTGVLSATFGVISAFFTLRHLDALVQFLSFLQGRDAFQAAFFGTKLPDSLSLAATYFIIIVTITVSFLAGILPALKAIKIPVSQALRSE